MPETASPARALARDNCALQAFFPFVTGIEPIQAPFYTFGSTPTGIMVRWASSARTVRYSANFCESSAECPGGKHHLPPQLVNLQQQPSPLPKQDIRPIEVGSRSEVLPTITHPGRIVWFVSRSLPAHQEATGRRR